MAGRVSLRVALIALACASALPARAEEDAALRPIMGCVGLHESVHFVRKKLEVTQDEGHDALRAHWQDHVAAHKGDADDYTLTELYSAATRVYWPMVLEAEGDRKAGRSSEAAPSEADTAYRAALADCAALDAQLSEAAPAQ